MGKVVGVFFIVIFLVILTLIILRYFLKNKILRKSQKWIKEEGMAELVELQVNGTKQFILLEGKSPDKPIILFLHGGPGQPIPFGVSSRGVYPEIAENFIAVYYDQRGSGKSYHKDIPIETMNVHQFVDDTKQIIDYLTERFGQDKIYLSGMSWGSIIGMKCVEEYPEKIKGYFGISQFVNNAENQRLSTKWLRDIAVRKNSKKLKEDLASFGEPPYRIEKEEKYSKYISKYGGDNYSDEKIKKANILNFLKPIFSSPDYTLKDIYSVLVGGAKFSLFTAKELQKEIQQEVDLQTIRRVHAPIYMFQGKHDKLTNYDLALDFFNKLEVQGGKEFITLENSAHYPNEEDFKIIIDKLMKVSKRR
ncbi:alpha/beta fold hydrolase [Bacillus sp. JJ1609]|uniref:alpha/beta fold hydrolase n=1 Tax=Bacillus sp. JJ1609 TaxID=3122977 RepID=UPI002FFE40AA